jgi:hypothetical protein
LSRRQVKAVLPTGSTFDLPRHEAAEMVRDGAANWSDFSYSKIIVNQQGALRMRGLSCRVGPELATQFRRDENKEGWAAVATSLIQLALPRKCKKPRQRPGFSLLHRLRPSFSEKTA